MNARTSSIRFSASSVALAAGLASVAQADVLSHGEGCAVGDAPIPIIGVEGFTAEDNEFNVKVVGEPGSVGMLFHGLAMDLSLQTRCDVLVPGVASTPYLLGAHGEVEFPFVGWAAGESHYFQAVHRDPIEGVSSSRVLEIKTCDPGFGDPPSSPWDVSGSVVVMPTDSAVITYDFDTGDYAVDKGGDPSYQTGTMLVTPNEADHSVSIEGILHQGGDSIFSRTTARIGDCGEYLYVSGTVNGTLAMQYTYNTETGEFTDMVADDGIGDAEAPFDWDHFHELSQQVAGLLPPGSMNMSGDSMGTPGFDTGDAQEAEEEESDGWGFWSGTAACAGAGAAAGWCIGGALGGVGLTCCWANVGSAPLYFKCLEELGVLPDGKEPKEEEEKEQVEH